MRMLRFAVGAPGVVVSTVVVAMIGAVLPPWGGIVVGYGGVAVAVLLGVGRLEPHALRVWCGARPPDGDEAAVLAAAVTRLCRAGIGPPVVDIYVSRTGGQSAWAAGSRGVVVPWSMVAAVAEGRLSAEEAAAAMAHAVGVLDVAHGRLQLVYEFWTLPWMLVAGVATSVGRAFAATPLVGWAWKVRGLYGVIALVQCTRDGYWFVGVIACGFLAETYLQPWLRRRWTIRVHERADQFVARHGLAEAWARLLARRAAATARIERIRRLAATDRQHPTTGPVVVH